MEAPLRPCRPAKCANKAGCRRPAGDLQKVSVRAATEQSSGFIETSDALFRIFQRRTTLLSRLIPAKCSHHAGVDSEVALFGEFLLLLSVRRRHVFNKRTDRETSPGVLQVLVQAWHSALSADISKFTSDLGDRHNCQPAMDIRA